MQITEPNKREDIESKAIQIKVLISSSCALVIESSVNCWIVDRIHVGAENVAAGSQQMSATAEEMAAGASEQAAS
ncbi:hypothetical protein MCHI_000154, partial [Candidatus Magnetoovum chiemensis]